ncbi:HTH-type transcriptional regulator MhqR [bacterium BMS3Abin05]|nr:HTH-type transcriptional regulator MhqR [bacterium BMS3Abin05]
MAVLEKRANELNGYIERMIHAFMVTQCGCLSDAAANLSMQELKVIKFIGNNGPSIMRQIADYLMLAMSTMTGIVDKLVEKKYVVRKRSEEDRRIVRVALTEAGREIYEMDHKNFMELSRQMLQPLDEEEQETLINLLRKISRVR